MTAQLFALHTGASRKQVCSASEQVVLPAVSLAERELPWYSYTTSQKMNGVEATCVFFKQCRPKTTRVSIQTFWKCLNKEARMGNSEEWHPFPSTRCMYTTATLQNHGRSIFTLKCSEGSIGCGHSLGHFVHQQLTMYNCPAEAPRRDCSYCCDLWAVWFHLPVSSKMTQ